MMTDEEALEFYDKLVEYYGADVLADPIHYPKTFEHQVKMYRYYSTKKEEETLDEQQN